VQIKEQQTKLEQMAEEIAKLEHSLDTVCSARKPNFNQACDLDGCYCFCFI